MEDVVKRIAEALITHGRKASSGEPLFFDRNNLERIIRQELEKK